MKKFFSIISIIIIICMCSSITAFGAGSGFDMPKIPIPNKAGDSGSSLPGADSQFETEGVKIPSADEIAKITSSLVFINKCSVSGIKNKVYTGKAITQKITVKYGKKTLKNGTDYKVSYSNNKNVGTATVKIVGKGKYIGSLTKTFTIRPIGTSFNKKYTPKKGKVVISWKKQTKQVTGYQIQYSTNKKFKKDNQAVKVKGAKNVKTTLKKLTSKKKYYVRIRTYKTVTTKSKNKTVKKNYYSAWSKVKTVKAK